MPPLEQVLDVFVCVIAPAFLVAAIVLGAIVHLFGNRASGLGAAAAFLAGCVAANFFRGGALPWLPDRQGWHWLLWVTTFAMLVGLAARGPNVPTLAGWLLRALMAGHAAWLLVPSGMQNESHWALPAFALVVFVEWGVLELLANKLPGGALPFASALAFLGAAAVLIHAHSARMTDVATFIAATLIGVAAIASWKEADVGAVMPAVAVMLPGLLLSGFYETYSEVPWRAYTLVALAPITLIISLAPLLLRLRSPFSQIVLIGLILLPVAIGVALAMQAETLTFE